jgi:succinate dehydrogenase assembly factor 2
MNSLIKISRLSNILISRRPGVLGASLRLKGTNEPPKSEAEQIEVIHKNEETYFTEVKKSFDNLKVQRAYETVEEKRSRLLYQSRKRGTLENGLLLSNFSAKYLPDMNEKELNEFDSIINNLTNEWDLYYWLTNAIQVPKELEDSKVLKSMKEYCANDMKQVRILQPDLDSIKRKF